MSKLKIGIVAGEHSGDLLGADLMSALSDLASQKNIEIEYRGIAGPKMMALGCSSYFDMEELSVMGIVEILKRLPRLLKKRKQLVQDLADWKPDVVIGIDAPEFNLGLELKLKEQGFKTIHYVSPSVWAWRQSRIKTIKKACDKVLALLPFEKAFYDKHQMPCDFVGHTLADQIPLESQKLQCREKLNLMASDKVLAVLPGSRGSEIKFLLSPFLATAKQLKNELADLKILDPAVNEYRANQIQQQIDAQFPELNIVVSVGNARDVMGAADAVLLASGTATLETMLMKTPMVTAYKVGWFSYAVFSRMIKTPYFTLPNLLANKALVAELIQEEATVENLVSHIKPLLMEPQIELIKTFTKLHADIRCDASATAAKAVWEIMEMNGNNKNNGMKE